MNWKEILALAVFTPPAFLAVMWMIGATVEQIGKRQVEHERCLRNAVNWLEARECR
jgi:hypothetical protein